MGAWAQVYKKGLDAAPGSSLGHAIVAVKNELAYNGFAGKMILSTPVIGDAASAEIVAFQKANGLLADGIVGPLTAEVLFRARARKIQTAKKIPGDYLCKIKTQESTNDPGAFGYFDPDDHGLVEINVRLHPNISIAEAIDPAFCLPWAGNYLATAFDELGDWPAAVASYNVGVGGAQTWLAAGKPPNGGTPDDPTLFERATSYVFRVLRSTC